MIDFQKELNEEQLRAVQEGDGPCLVLAGAGSGKTRVITYRVAYLLEKGVKPENILLVTFTNKAAGEMVSRVRDLSSRSQPFVIPAKAGIQGGELLDSRFRGNDSESENRLPWAGTFHHIANKILRVYAPFLNFQGQTFYKNTFSVLDSDDSEALLKICSKPYRSSDSWQRFPSASILRNLISYARNAGMSIHDVLELKYPQALYFVKDIESVASEYEKRKREANAMDFDDLLLNLLRLLQDENIRNKFSSQFQFVLVDEYQDTNKIQADIIDLLSGVHKNIFVVGDDAQSIYSFRGADVNNILNFEKKYPSAKIFKLETNYRSTQKILDLANNVIANNRKQYKKNLKTLLPGENCPELRPCLDQTSEAEMVAKRIKELLVSGVPAPEVAVLFRATHHSQMLEMELMKRGIAYDYRGGVRFFERAHIKDILSYLRIVNNLADAPAWFRVLTKEEGIGTVGAQKVIEEIKKIDKVEEVKNVGLRALGERAKNGWNNFMGLWEKLLGMNKKPADLIKTAIESGYKDYLETEYLDAKDRSADLFQLLEFAKKYDSLEDFLAEASLQEGFNMSTSATPPYPLLERGGGMRPPSAREGVGAQSATGGVGSKIVLSTIHQAKGLEWQNVFILNLANGGFPNERALRENDGLEEERRLFYVAITRAKKNLCLTYPLAGGFAGDSIAGPSLFLSEISEGLLDDHSLLTTDSFTVYNDESEDITYVAEDMPKIRPGSFLRDVDDL